MAARGRRAYETHVAALDALVANAVLDSLPDEIAVLDANGAIVAVNESWRRFAREHGGDPGGYVGWSYLRACEDAVLRGGDGPTQRLVDALKAILAGGRECFSADYRCVSPDDPRWFVVHLTPCEPESPWRVVVAHHDVTARRRIEEELTETGRTLRAVLEALPVGVWIMDAAGRIVGGNREGIRIWGGARYVTPEEFGAYKGWWVDTGKPIAADEWAAARAMKGETSLDEEIEIECFDGTRRMILNSAIPLLDRDGAVAGAIIVNQDVTSRKKGEAALRTSEEKWRRLFSILPVGVSLVDAERRIVEMNPALERVLQISATDLATGAWRRRMYIRPDGAPLADDELPSTRVLRDGITVENEEIGVVKEDGGVIWTSVSAAPLPLPEARAVVVTVDVTPRKNAERELHEVLRHEQELARTDALTGLTNRRQFFELASRQLALSLRSRRSLSLALFDVDLFKEINDRFGHAAGDEVLREVARRAVEGSLRDVDVVARIGGDEFVALLPDCGSEQARAVAERIRAAVAASPVAAPAGEVAVTISAGVASAALGDTLERLLHRADEALYAAKAAGRYRVISPSRVRDPGAPGLSGGHTFRAELQELPNGHGLARRARERRVERARGAEALGRVLPVPDVPDGLEELRLTVLILQVVRVLPRVEHEDRHARLSHVRLVVVELRDEEALAERLPDERGPARAHDRARGLGHLLPERIERAEIVRQRRVELAAGTPARLRCEVLPEHRVQDVAGDVERERLLEAGEGGEVLLLASRLELLQRLVRALHVGGMVLVVVELHDLSGNVGFQSSEVVVQVGEGVGVQGTSFRAARPIGRAGRFDARSVPPSGTSGGDPP
jgi:diguanylate cyclase (GGDEF)-like protein/PAS domain S-box-containing protein